MQGNRTVLVLSLFVALVVAGGLWFGLRDVQTVDDEGGSSHQGGSTPVAPDEPAPLVNRSVAGHGHGRLTGRPRSGFRSFRAPPRLLRLLPT